jgi:hypothetical protein
MTLEYAVCPHCGCHCDDDEFCAACGKLFHEAPTPSRDVSILGVLWSGLRSLFQKTKEDSCRDKRNHLPTSEFLLEQADQETDPSWSFLPSNIYNEDRMTNHARDIAVDPSWATLSTNINNDDYLDN